MSRTDSCHCTATICPSSTRLSPIQPSGLYHLGIFGLALLRFGGVGLFFVKLTFFPFAFMLTVARSAVCVRLPHIVNVHRYFTLPGLVSFACVRVSSNVFRGWCRRSHRWREKAVHAPSCDETLAAMLIQHEGSDTVHVEPVIHSEISSLILHTLPFLSSTFALICTASLCQCALTATASCPSRGQWEGTDMHDELA
jgi:hypothetical protein